MKPAPFAYAEAASAEHACGLLVRCGDEARLLVGGQSPTATPTRRRPAPAILINIDGLDELGGIAPEVGALWTGGLTRQRGFARSDAGAPAGPAAEHPARAEQGRPASHEAWFVGPGGPEGKA